MNDNVFSSGRHVADSDVMGSGRAAAAAAGSHDASCQSLLPSLCLTSQWRAGYRAAVIIELLAVLGTAASTFLHRISSNSIIILWLNLVKSMCYYWTIFRSCEKSWDTVL